MFSAMIPENDANKLAHALMSILRLLDLLWAIVHGAADSCAALPAPGIAILVGAGDSRFRAAGHPRFPALPASIHSVPVSRHGPAFAR